MRAPGAASRLCFAASALLLWSGCAKQVPPQTPTPPRVQVVLLEDAESEVPSAAVVETPSGTVTLTTAFQSTEVTSNRAPAPPVTLDAAQVQREFGSVLASLPADPNRFNLYFGTASELTDESRAMLPEVIKTVAARTIPEVTVIGHTDTTGSAEDNYKLGLERAEAVKALIVQAGLDASVIQVESHGEADLLHKTADNTAEPRNRRVEITVR
jgi:outer membrane protein OmpA-like peptidoglycan-associated protein